MDTFLHVHQDTMRRAAINLKIRTWIITIQAAIGRNSGVQCATEHRLFRLNLYTINYISKPLLMTGVEGGDCLTDLCQMSGAAFKFLYFI